MALQAKEQGKSAGRKEYYSSVVDEKGRWLNTVKIVEDALKDPLHWRHPRIIFVNSMSDLFHEETPAIFIQRVFEVMKAASWHTFQILTKRPERAQEMAESLPWPPNVWIGTSVENESVLTRVESLCRIPARVLFLSLEPLLGPLSSLNLTGINWLIVGGESGPRARPMKPEWVREIRDKALSANVPFFLSSGVEETRKHPGAFSMARPGIKCRPTCAQIPMAEDSLPTVWDADPHTTAKLSILKAYLQAWMPILSRQAVSQGRRGEVVYIDAFAGPGKYRTGEPGSPLIAVSAAKDHTHDFPVPIRMFFVEKRQDRWQHLNDLLAPFTKEHQRNIIVEAPLQGAADDEVRRLIRDRRFQQYCPTLVFLDQFGYSAVPMELIRAIMAGSSREVLSFMNWRDLNRYVSDQTKWPGIDRAFGGTEWRQILDVDDSTQRSRLFLQLYDEALRTRGKVVYSYSFSMHDHSGQLLYWLIFCSNSDRGLEEMKRAMWSVDTTGSFRFSDRHSGQLDLLPGFDQTWLASTLISSLADRQMNVGEIRHYVLTETPCYKYADALALLERREKLKIVSSPPGRRKGAFAKYVDAPGLVIRFGSEANLLGV